MTVGDAVPESVAKEDAAVTPVSEMLSNGERGVNEPEPVALDAEI